jgi:Raf kinase inhibitor-like YbhB/YbcL family protein
MIILVAVALTVAGTGWKEAAGMASLTLTSPQFEHKGHIPQRYTCDGPDLNPPLAINGVPDGTQSLVLIVDDPDAPRGTWVHWVVWNIDPSVREIGEGVVPRGCLQGVNDFGKNAYGGPCPPSGTHRYFFKLYALDIKLNVGKGSRKADIEKAMSGHIAAQAELIGLYSRK